jgi:hypothetical protein
MNNVANTISLLILRMFNTSHDNDQSLQSVSLLSCFGLAVSLGLIGSGFDLGGGWL